MQLIFIVYHGEHIKRRPVRPSSWSFQLGEVCPDRTESVLILHILTREIFHHRPFYNVFCPTPIT